MALASVIYSGLSAPGTVLASQYTFTGPTNGLWNSAANWTLNGGSTHTVPANGDDASVGTNAAGSTQVIFNGSYSGAGLNSLTLNSPGVPEIILVQNTSGSAMAATSEFIGTTVDANYYNQSAGTNTTTNLYLGNQSGGAGEYFVGGSGVLSANYETIGVNGTGVGYLTQTGGTNNVTYGVTIGNYQATTNFSTYTMTGGSLNLTATGSYASTITVGGGPAGSFNQTGGTVNASPNGDSTINVFSNGSSYILSGTGQIAGTYELEVGAPTGSSKFIQDSGTSQNAGSGILFIGLGGSTGTYFQNGGTLIANIENVGFNVDFDGDTPVPANGTFQQSGGINTVGDANDGNLSIGVYGGNGTYYLLGSSTLTVNGEESLGSGLGSICQGLLQQSGGTQTINGTLDIGQFNGSGTYLMYAGLLTVNGSVVVGSSTNIEAGLGYGYGEIGIYGPATMNVSGGVISLGNNPTGNEGSATMQQTDGTVNTSGLQVGNTSVGTYFLDNGSPVLNVTGSEEIGIAALGELDQTTGTHSVNGGLYVGYGNGGTGTLSLSGGNTNVSGGRDVLYVGYQNGSFGTLDVFGTANLMALGNVFVGYAGVGTVDQSGGSATVTDALFIGYESGAIGSVYLQGGNLSAGTVYVGYSGNGKVIQSAGAFNISTGLGIGIFTPASYILTGGSLHLPSGATYGEIYPGSVFNQSAGTVSGLLVNNGLFLFSGGGFLAGAALANTEGIAYFRADAGADGQNLDVNISGGSVTFETTQHLAGLNITIGGFAQVTGAGNGHRSIVYTPSLAVTGSLDLTNNDLDVQGGGLSALANVTALIASAYNNGAWNAIGVTSSSAADDPTHLTAVGVMLDSGSITSLDGFPVAPGDVLVKYTYYGDANLDGRVDASDYSWIDNGYLNHLSGWSNGDFNYDGVVNGSDYTLIDNAFNRQGAQLDGQIADPTAQYAGSASEVPEPALLGLIGISPASLLGRRRSRLVSKSSLRTTMPCRRIAAKPPRSARR